MPKQFPEWTPDHSVGDAMLDEQHKHFFEIVNKIVALREKPNMTKEEVLLVLTELGNNALYHFDYEEKFLYEKKPAGYLEHIAKHVVYKQELRDFMNKAEATETDAPELAKKVAQFAEEWLERHMLGAMKSETQGGAASAAVK